MLPGLFRNASRMYDCTSRVLQHYEALYRLVGIPEKEMMHSIMKNSKFELFLMKVVQQKVVTGLIPLLNHISKSNIEVDLQEVFKRFTFDNSCLMVLGFDPISLSVEFPKRTYEKAFDEIEEAILYRHIVPKWCWKLQRWLQIGQEKKLRKAWDAFDRFLNQRIASKREQLLSREKTHLEEAKFDLLTAYMMQEEIVNMGVCSKSNKILRDTAFNLIAAGSDTMGAGLARFFWLIATHPSVEMKILKEIKENLMVKDDKKEVGVFRTAVKADTLPSGHHISANTPIIISLYAMGRMEEIWGEDCIQYKPERWISEQGGLISVPSYKFTAFGGGPRSCLGKAMAFIQMKIVATSIIWNFHFEMVEGHPVSPSVSVVLHMKHGLKVRITKRSV
uniref:Cytochrome P450 n=1 Tax=Quercus lobata TaxID=97700 RepID=A0A7N2KT21_QUELO